MLAGALIRWNIFLGTRFQWRLYPGAVAVDARQEKAIIEFWIVRCLNQEWEK
jgi:hypothetical protein